MGEFNIIKFIDNNFEIDVRTDINNETVWLTQKEMALLFEVSIDNISLHIKNILKENELDISTVEESSIVQSEGKRKVHRAIKIYNLDMIISIGYRVKSQRGIIFRKWANKILKEYLIQGYSINKRRIEFYKRNGFHVETENPVILNEAHTHSTCVLQLIASSPLQNADECQKRVVDIVYKSMEEI